MSGKQNKKSTKKVAVKDPVVVIAESLMKVEVPESLVVIRDRAVATVAKLADRIHGEAGKVAKAAEREAKKVARTEAKAKREATKVEQKKAKAAKLTERIAKLQAQVKDLS